jgi:cytochrome P450
MSTIQTTSIPTAIESLSRCPIDHTAWSKQKAVRPTEAHPVPLIRDAQGVWQVYGFAEARAILRGSNTKQAGFNAEQMGQIPGVHNQPILYLEGKIHQQQRKQTARFFTPKAVDSDYRHMMEKLADELVNNVKRRKHSDISQLSLVMAVQVAAQVVGVTNSRLPGMGKRLDAFFTQKPASPGLLSLLRWKPLATLGELYRQRHMLTFFWLDVLPAIHVRKRQPQEDVISHLLAQNYSSTEILTECVTYAAAGMVTTREFICIAAWHFLEHPELRARYLAAPEEERLEILHETLRLEPIVGNLYRRVTTDLIIESEGKDVTIPAGDLVNIHIDATNTDLTVLAKDALVLCPGRELQGDRIPSMMMSFGDGHHRCPGSSLAIQETDIFLHRLLAIENLHIERPPMLNWNELTTGYEIRQFLLACD